LSKREVDTSAGCPETPLLRGSQVTDSMSPEFRVLGAHKEMFVESETSPSSSHFAVGVIRSRCIRSCQRFDADSCL